MVFTVRLLVKILSIMVVEFSVVLVGFIILGSKPKLHIKSKKLLYLAFDSILSKLILKSPNMYIALFSFNVLVSTVSIYSRNALCLLVSSLGCL